MSVFLRSNLVLAAFLLVTSSAWAQERADLSAPPVGLSEEVTLSDVMEAQDEVISPEEEAELMASEPAIEIAEFEAPKGGGMGFLSANKAGLPYNLWQGLDEKQVFSLLEYVPESIQSAAIRHLWARVLVMETARADFGESVLAARVNALLKMGQAKLAIKLLENVPESVASADLQKQRYLLQTLAANSNKTVCKQASDHQAANPEAFWQHFKVLCQALNQETAKVQLGVELLREQNHASDLFTNIVKSIINKTPLEQNIKMLKREELAWLGFAGKLPKGIEEGLSAETLSLIALKGQPSTELAKLAKEKHLNISHLSAPRDSSPDIPLSLMRLKETSSDDDTKNALVAVAMRRAWDKPISIEVEESLISRAYQAKVKELSVIWREEASKLQDSEQGLEALFVLLRPLTGKLSDYTVSDLTFLVGELKALGLTNDAAAIAQEALTK